MFEGLAEAEKKYDKINDMLMQPDIVSDTEKYSKLMREP